MKLLRRSSWLAIGLWWVAVGGLGAQDLGVITARFQAELDRLRREARFPGATAAFALPDGRIMGIATGLADRERNIPMNPDSRMLAASIGKTFVAATAVAL